jgi:hypothetical protein
MRIRIKTLPLFKVGADFTGKATTFIIIYSYWPFQPIAWSTYFQSQSMWFKKKLWKHMWQDENFLKGDETFVKVHYFEASDRTSWSSGYHSFFVLRRPRIQILALRTSMLRVFVVFLSPSWQSPGVVPSIKPRRLPSTHFPLQHSLISLLSDAIYSEILKTSLNKLQNKHLKLVFGFLPFIWKYLWLMR